MRLITRSDFDGLVCAAILRELKIVNSYLYTHPKDLQDNKIAVNKNDVLVNVPYVEGCGLWFDHHTSEENRIKNKVEFKGSFSPEPSAARVIYNYYKNNNIYTEKLKQFEDMVKWVDYTDSGQFTKEDVLNPKGWVLLALLADPRTNLGYTKEYSISNFELMKTLPDMLIKYKSPYDILDLPNFKERVIQYKEENEKYIAFIKEKAKITKNIILLDFRKEDKIPSGNRFIEYVLFPKQNISLRLVNGKNKEFIMISVGYSIINPSSNVDVGKLMQKYGGGGHKKVGTCQLKPKETDSKLKEIIDHITT